MLFIAELGSLHKGVEPLAYEMVRRAAESGAGAVKFQYGWPKTRGPERRWATDNADKIREWANHFGIRLCVSVFSDEGLSVATSTGVDILKMAHPETFRTNAPDQDYNKLLDGCIATGKPVLASGIRDSRVRALYCVPRYPVYENRLSLPARFVDYCGYSSHTPGIADALVAIARGATIIEKHVTLNNSDITIRDHAFALDFDQLAEMIRIGRAVGRFNC